MSRFADWIQKISKLSESNNNALDFDLSELSTNNDSDTNIYFVVVEKEQINTSLTDLQDNLLQKADINSNILNSYEELGIFSLELTPEQALDLQKIKGIESVSLNENIEVIDPLNINFSTETRPRKIDQYDFKLDFFNKEIDNKFSICNSDNSCGSLNDVFGSKISSLPPTYYDGYSSSGDRLPYGVKAIWKGEDVGERGNIGRGTYAFVLDTGVVGSQTDLNINTKWGKSFISGQSAYVDGHGHGTHVSGTIGALSNGVGVIGVAPGAEIIPIKVLSDAGWGSWSGVIDGINYCVKIIEDNDLDKSKCVLNLSLGGGYNAAVDAAVKRAADKGILFSIAAGNSNMDADGYSPAAAGDHENVYTISAVDNKYKMAYFSNWDDPSGGDDVDFAAPGVNVLSYTKTGAISAWSGTSMAAPHVAGALLLGSIKSGPMVTPNSSGYGDPFAFVNYGGEDPEDPPEDPEDPPEDPDDPIKGTGNVAVYNQPGLNGRGIGDSSDETKNLLSIVQNEIDSGASYKIDYSLKNYTDTSKLEEVLDNTNIFIMPEHETHFKFPDSARKLVREFVNKGGTMIQVGDYRQTATDFINEIFGWNLSKEGWARPSSLTLNTANAKGTVYESGPSTLRYNDVTMQIGKGSVSTFKAIYGDDNTSSVAEIGYGSGKVIYIGEDYFSHGYATDWGEGTHRKGYYTDSYKWASEILPRALKSGTSEATKYSELSGKYFYGNGDWYEFSGIISEEFGGGSYEADQKIYADSSEKDAFSKNINETGKRGYYLIEKVENKISFSEVKDKITIGNYFDFETFLSINPFETNDGSKGFGSESGWLSSKESYSNDKFDSFFEADPLSVIESKGKLYLATDHDKYFYVRNLSNDLFCITRKGKKVKGNATWQLKAAEKISGVNLVIDQNVKSKIFYVWEMTDEWKYTKNYGGGQYRPSQDKYYQAEKDFQVDLNGDGTIGYKLKNIESKGNKKLLQDNINGFHVRDEKGAVHEITRKGKKVKSNATWQLKAAERIGGVNLVIDQNVKSKIFYVWKMTDEWKYTKNYGGGQYRPSQDKYYQAEKDFQVDLNGDGTIGYKLKNIESKGNKKLLQDNFNGFHVRDEKGAVHEITRKGKKVKGNATWQLKAAERIGGLNLVIDQNVKSKIFYVWKMTDEWKYTKNYGGGQYRPSQDKYYQAEKDFQVDLNGDGTIGYKLKNIESKGNKKLLQDNFNGFHVRDEKGAVHEITRKGKKVKGNATWQLKAAERIGGVNLVIDQNVKSKIFYVWEMTDEWKYIKNYGGGQYRPSQDKYLQAEKDFQVDLNGDGTIGYKLKNIESKGNKKLLQDNFNVFHVRDEKGALHEITRKGKKVKGNATWQLKAAERIGGVNLVIDQNVKSKNFYVWEMTDEWKFIRNYGGGQYRTSQDKYYQAEKDFQVDLNGDKVIGLKTEKLESTGNQSLLQDTINGLHVKDADGYFHPILENGKKIRSNLNLEFKAAETLKGVNHIVAKNIKTQSIHLLEMDKNWSIENISSKSTNLKDGEDSFFKVEKDFHLDLNYDGFYGNPVI